MPEEISDEISSRSFTQSLQRLSKVVSTDTYNSALKTRATICYVVDLSDVPKCGSFNPYGNEQMESKPEAGMDVDKPVSVESLDGFLIRVANDLDIPLEEQKAIIDSWKSNLGSLTTQKKHIETLISDENGWNNIQLEQIVKSTIRKLLTSSQEKKRAADDMTTEELQAVLYKRRRVEQENMEPVAISVTVLPHSPSQFVASSHHPLLGCCLSLMPLPFAIPTAAQVLIDMKPTDDQLSSAVSTLKQGYSQLIFSSGMTGETTSATRNQNNNASSSFTVTEVTGEALSTFFHQTHLPRIIVRRASSLGQLNAPVGHASPSGMPDISVVSFASPTLLLAIIELKDTSFSSLESFGQACSEASNGVLSQHDQFQVPLAKCIVPFICTNGVNYLFACATLLSDRFVNFSVLSPDLNITSDSDLVTTSRFLAQFRMHSISFHDTHHPISFHDTHHSSNRVLQAPDPSKFVINPTMYHVKENTKIVLQFPHAQGWKCYMDIFVKLWSQPLLRSSIVFPVSFCILSNATQPGILFDLLPNEWQIGVPIAARANFCSKLKEIVKLVHGAGLVHLDLCPCNIASKLNGNDIEMKLLDFDSATAVNSQISQLLLDHRATPSTLFWDRDCSTTKPQIDAWFCYLYEKLENEYLVQKSINVATAAEEVMQAFSKYSESKKYEEVRSGFETWFLTWNPTV